MNLTNYHKTPLALVVETIRREAARYGVMIHHAELVGLIPQAALVDAAVWYLQLDQFKPEQILEQKLYSLAQPSQKASLEQPEYGTEFLDALASRWSRLGVVLHLHILAQRLLVWYPWLLT